VQGLGMKGFRVGIGPSDLRTRATLLGTGLYYEKKAEFSKAWAEEANGDKGTNAQAGDHGCFATAQLEVEAFQNRLEMLLSVH